MNEPSRLEVLENEVEELVEDLRCFWTGNTPENATISQIILAQWGRKRLEKMKAEE